jgi:hypothetical protein
MAAAPSARLAAILLIFRFPNDLKPFGRRIARHRGCFRNPSLNLTTYQYLISYPAVQEPIPLTPIWSHDIP